MRMFSFGRYEILECSKPYNSSDKVVQIIQGADVNVLNIDLRTHIHWKNNIINSSIEKVSFLIDDKNHKLGDIFFSSPYGIIKKNRTGIGATTLELNSKRNSIIVVPTKALAFSKALSYFEKDGTWSVLYVGSNIDGAPNNMPDIIEYLSNNTIIHKKFIVVADSLYRVIDAIGADVYNSYFLMVDEIDSFQSDSTFRPKLEDVIDYYLNFESTKRCLVSATLNEFSNPVIAAEPVINIIYKDPIQKNIDLILTNNHNAVAVAEIKKYFALSTNKIVVAYNKIQFIRQIIEELGEEYKDECQILCSPASKGNADRFYAELNGRSLSKRITFITCTYFVGIDIDDRFHLISISNYKHPYTLLSLDKLIQIAGRCRDNAGLFSETIIYDTVENRFPKSPEQIKVDTLALAHDLKTYVKNLDDIAKKYPDIISSGFYAAKDAIIEKATFDFTNSDSIPILRKSISSEYVPAYFNIDAIFEYHKFCNDLYSNPDQLISVLAANGNIVNHVSHYIDISDTQKAIAKSVAVDMAATLETELNVLISSLSGLFEYDNLNFRSLRELRLTHNTSKYCRVFLDRFVTLYEIVPFEQLIDKLKYIIFNDDREFQSLNNSAVFWALDLAHPFKHDLINHLPIGTQFQRNDLAVIVQHLSDYHLNRNLSDINSIRFIRQFCDMTRGKSKNTIYTVKSYNRHNFIGEPLKLIAKNANLSELFKFAT